MILKLAMNRLHIHKNKKIEQSMAHKEAVAKLIEQGKSSQARVMVFFSFFSKVGFSFIFFFLKKRLLVSFLKIILLKYLTLLNYIVILV